MKIEFEITEKLQAKIVKDYLEEVKDASLAFLHEVYHLHNMPEARVR